MFDFRQDNTFVLVVLAGEFRRVFISLSFG